MGEAKRRRDSGFLSSATVSSPVPVPDSDSPPAARHRLNLTLTPQIELALERAALLSGIPKTQIVTMALIQSLPWLASISDSFCSLSQNKNPQGF